MKVNPSAVIMHLYVMVAGVLLATLVAPAAGLALLGVGAALIIITD